MTLAGFEEPQVGADLVLDFTVTPEEAGEPRFAVFLNPPTRSFGFTVYRADGAVAYERTGTRGVQPFPALEEGRYKAFVRGEGAIQLTDKHLDRMSAGAPRVTDVNGTLRGADAYVFVPTRDWRLRVEGDVRVEWRDLAGATRQPAVPVDLPVARGAPHVLTLRGDESTPYRVWLEPVGEEPAEAGPGRVEPTREETPGMGALVLLPACCAAALLVRRRA